MKCPIFNPQRKPRILHPQATHVRHKISLLHLSFILNIKNFSLSIFWKECLVTHSRLRNKTLVFYSRILKKSLVFTPRIRKKHLVFNSRIWKESLIFNSRIWKKSLVFTPRIQKKHLVFNSRIWKESHVFNSRIWKKSHVSYSKIHKKPLAFPHSLHHRKKRQLQRTPCVLFCNLFWHKRPTTQTSSPSSAATYQMFNFWRYFIPIPWRPLWYQSTQAHPLWTLFMPSYSYGPYVSPPQGGQIFTTYGYSGESSESENPPQPSGSNSNHGSPSEGPMGTSPYGQDKGPNEQTQKTPGQSQTITHDPITMTTESHRTTYHTTVNTMNSVQHGNSMDPKPNTKPFTVQPNEDHSNSKPMKGSKPQEEGHSNSHPMTTPRPGTVGTNLTTVKPQSTNGKPNPDTKNETKCDKKKDEKDHKLEDLAKNFTQSVKKGESKVQNTLKELKQNVSESFKNSEKKVQNGIGEMKQTISESMKSNENKVKNGISEMKQNVSQLIKNSEKKLQNASQTLSEEKNLTNIWLSSEVNKLKEKWNNTMSSVGPKGNGQVGITPDVYQDWVEKTTSISFEQDHGNENNPSNTGNSHRDKNVNKNNPNNPEGSHSDEISIHGNQQSFSNKTKRYSKEFTQLFVLPNQFNFTKDGMNFLVPLWWNISEYEPEFGAGLFITKMRQEVQRNGKIEKELS